MFCSRPFGNALDNIALEIPRLEYRPANVQEKITWFNSTLI
jgi:hypothetical protein